MKTLERRWIIRGFLIFSDGAMERKPGGRLQSVKSNEKLIFRNRWILIGVSNRNQRATIRKHMNTMLS